MMLVNLVLKEKKSSFFESLNGKPFPLFTFIINVAIFGQQDKNKRPDTFILISQ